MTKFKIFKEDNRGPDNLEQKVNEFLSNKNVKITNICCVNERVDNIDYMNLLIFYVELEQ